MRTLILLAALFAVTSVAAPAQSSRPERDTITTPSGLKLVMIERGKGRRAKSGQLVIVHYIGRLMDGSGFDSSTHREPIAFRLGRGQVIKGWDEGIARLRVGDSATLVIPAALAYGDRAIGERIPANSPLVFHVRLVGTANQTAGDFLKKQIESRGVEKSASAWRDLAKRGFQGYYLSEAEINRIGYEYLQAGELAKAVAAFRANIVAFPNSANVYDSLGEGYAAIGDSAKAIENYERSLELDPSNGNAKTMIETLRSK